MVPQLQPTHRYPWGWFWLAAIFLLLVPGAIVGSFKHSDPNSKEPGVQAGNLEAAVAAESKKDHKEKELRKVVSALAPAHTTDDEAAAVYAVAKAELKEPLSPEDLKALQTSKLKRRRTLANLYSLPAGPELKRLANTLPTDIFLYKVAKAQVYEKLGDRSLRNQISPAFAERKLNSGEGLFAAFVMLGFGVGCILLFAYAVGLSTGEIAWRGHPVEPVTPLDADRLAVRAAQFMGVFLGVSMLVEGFAAYLPGEASEARTMAVGVVASALVLVSTLLLCKVPALGQNLNLSDFRVTTKLIGSSLLWGAAGVLVAVPIVSAGLVIGMVLEKVSPRPDHPLGHMLSNSHPWWAVLGALFLASIQAPVVEELIFRGTMLPAFSGLFRGSRYHIPLAIGLSSFLFASIHPQGFMLWLVLGGVGVINSVLCYQTRSVLPGMFMHGIYNGSLLLLTLVAS